MEIKLTDKQELFCVEYMKDLNATQAAIRAGYSEGSARVSACRLRAKDSIIARIDKLQSQYEKSSNFPINNDIKNLLLDFFDGDIKEAQKAIEYVIISALSDYESKVELLRIKRRAVEPNGRYSVFHRAGFKCQCCGARPTKSNDITLHIDHIIPVSIGGTNEMDNLQSLCQQCNISKGNRFLFNHNLD